MEPNSHQDGPSSFWLPIGENMLVVVVVGVGGGDGRCLRVLVLR